MINIKDYDPNLPKIDKKSYRNIDIYYIGYITKKNSYYIKINSSTEEKHGNKYLTFTSTDKNKKVLEKYAKLWDEIKYHIKTINGRIRQIRKRLHENQIQFGS